MRIDSHQHFWIYNPIEYAWIGPGQDAIRRDFTPANLLPELQTAGVDGSIVVQAPQTLAETEWLLSLADADPWIRGVVGWVDLCSPRVGAQLERFSAHPRLCGIRHSVQSEPDGSFFLRPDFQRGIAALEAYGLAYDLLITPRHLPAACQLAAKFPNQRFIVDHLAKPAIKDRVLSPWAEDLRRVARFPNVACKVSGMVTEAAWHNWQPGDFSPYLDAVLEAFGPKRMMFGSDWPVCLLSADYAQVHALLANYIARLSAAEQEMIWGDTAAEFYRLA